MKLKKLILIRRKEEVLARVDFNVPIKNGRIGDDGHIVSHLEMIEALSNAGSRLTLVSHLSRPKVKRLSLSLKPAAARLEELVKNQ